MGAHVVTDKQAYELMHAQCWPEAFASWQALQRSGVQLDALQLNAWAKCCEMLGEWALHESLVTKGLLGYPDNIDLVARNRYRQAIEFYHAGNWQAAAEQLELLRSNKPKEWPFALEYYYWQSMLMQQLSALLTREEKLIALAKASYFKNACIFSRQLAGFDSFVELSEWSEPLKRDMLRAYQLLVDAYKHHDGPLNEWRGEGGAACVAPFAELLRGGVGVIASMPAGYLHFFARLLLMHGYVDIYTACRCAFVEKIGRQEEEGGLAALLFSIALRNEQASTENPVVNHLCVETIDPQARVMVDKMLAVSELYRRPAQQGSYLTLSEESAFPALIAGKRIAIVGPADVGLEHGSEIDDFDVVVRFNHCSALELDEKRFGKRTDISYYAKGSIIRHRAYIESENNLRYVVTRLLDMRELDWLANVCVPVREHLRAWSVDSPLLFGMPNAVQRVLMDILRFCPARVKVFNTNLYLDVGYADGYAVKHFNIFPALSIHDPVSNFIFMKACASAWGVDSDEVLSGILRLTPEEYLSCLFSAHARFAK